MEKNKKIGSVADLDARILELQLENSLLLTQMKSDATSLSTYLPNAPLSEKLSFDSLASVTAQISKDGLTMGLLVPVILNNTIFRKQSTAVKTFVSALAMVLSDQLDIDDIKKTFKKIFKKKKKKKNKEATIVAEPFNTNTAFLD